MVEHHLAIEHVMQILFIFNESDASIQIKDLTTINANQIIMNGYDYGGTYIGDLDYLYKCHILECVSIQKNIIALTNYDINISSNNDDPIWCGLIFKLTDVTISGNKYKCMKLCDNNTTVKWKVFCIHK